MDHMFPQKRAIMFNVFINIYLLNDLIESLGRHVIVLITEEHHQSVLRTTRRKSAEQIWNHK